MSGERKVNTMKNIATVAAVVVVIPVLIVVLVIGAVQDFLFRLFNCGPFNLDKDCTKEKRVEPISDDELDELIKKAIQARKDGNKEVNKANGQGQEYGKPWNPVGGGNGGGSGNYDNGCGPYTGQFADLINKHAKENGVDPQLVAAIIKIESNFNPKTTSKAGAQGLMQLMPQYLAYFGVKDGYDPDDNIGGGTREIKKYLDMRNGDLPLALASYNWGPGSVNNAMKKYGNSWDAIKGHAPKETFNYIPKVTGAYENYKKDAGSCTGGGGAGGSGGGGSVGPATGGYAGPDFDFTKGPFVPTPATLNAALKNVMSGMGQTFYDKGVAAGINPAFMVAIANLETGHGTSNLARTQNNIGGIKCPGGEGRRFISGCRGGNAVYASLGDSLDHKVWILNNMCKNAGATTVRTCWKIYSPIDDGNPTWGPDVMNLMVKAGQPINGQNPPPVPGGNGNGGVVGPTQPGGDPNSTTCKTPTGGLHPEVEKMKNELIAKAQAAGIPIKVTEGYRSLERQQELYNKGRTTPGSIVTKAKPGDSFHNWGLAFDVVFVKGGDPYANGDLNHNGKNDWQEIGAIGKSVGLDWGGYWTGDFVDQPHFEKKIHSLAELKAKQLEDPGFIYPCLNGVGSGGGTTTGGGTGPSGEVKRKNVSAEDEASIHIRALMQTDMVAVAGLELNEKNVDDLLDFEKGQFKGTNLAKTWLIAKNKKPEKHWTIEERLMDVRYDVFKCYLIGDIEGLLAFPGDDVPCQNLDKAIKKASDGKIEKFVPDGDRGVLLHLVEQETITYACEKVEPPKGQEKQAATSQKGTYTFGDGGGKAKVKQAFGLDDFWNFIKPGGARVPKIVSKNPPIENHASCGAGEKEVEAGRSTETEIKYKALIEDVLYHFEPLALIQKKEEGKDNPTDTVYRDEDKYIPMINYYLNEFYKDAKEDTSDDGNGSTGGTGGGVIIPNVPGDLKPPILPEERGGMWTVTSTYGDPSRASHYGTDIGVAGNAPGTPIRASKDGTVRYAAFGPPGSGFGGYGNVVSIMHEGGVATLYGHMSSLAVKVGQQVKQGEIVGYMGSTGQSTATHLHFEVCVKPVQGGNCDKPSGFVDATKVVQLPGRMQWAKDFYKK